MSVTRSHSLSIGIVGLPNSGKSTIFNVLTKSAVPAESYPFCTIDKNVGVVKIPDRRLDKMSEFFKAQKIVPSAITFVDIAGLVKGASKGEGLGNQFLSHIREVSLIMYVLRGFKSDKVTHVYDQINPAEDLKIVRSELILKDIDTVERKQNEVQGKAKTGMSDEVKFQLGALKKLMMAFDAGRPAYVAGLTKEEKEFVRDLWLLTDKPAIYLVNIKGGVEEKDMKAWMSELEKEIPAEEKDFVVQVDCKMESELEGLSLDERKDILSLVDGYQGVDEIIMKAYKRLELLTFYTGSEKECNAWTIGRGATVQEAAGVIHTDLADTFVVAEVINVDKLVDVGGWVKAREAGLIRTEGKGYLIQDGDYINVLTNK